MNILIGTLIFNGYTGSEWYNFELIKGLLSMKNEKGKSINKVTLISNTHPETRLTGILRKMGCEIINITKNHTLPYNIDVVHFSHNPIGDYLLKRKELKKAKFVTTIHSEIIALENPVINERISKYITIRPSISYKIMKDFGIDESKISLIYNPIDDTKFNLENVSDERFVLFHGSLDYLRHNAILDCVEKSKNEGLKTVFVGRNDYPHEFNTEMMPTCEFLSPMPDIVDLVKKCTYTAGILLGRSTIEGYFCGKKGLIYNVDNKGNILSSSYTDQFPLDKYKAENVVNQIYRIYQHD